MRDFLSYLPAAALFLCAVWVLATAPGKGGMIDGQLLVRKLREKERRRDK